MNQQLSWYEAVAECERRGVAYVLITVVGVTGSVPREPSSKMVVTGEHTYDTIGGGHLEYRACARAREQIANEQWRSELAHFPLGASLGQCCGGSVSVLFEAQPGCHAKLVVFGAGHVAHALMTIMGQLPWRVTWVDQRANAFPPAPPSNVEVRQTDDPVGDAATLTANAHVLILTHNHQLDFELCRTLLRAGTARSIGLIGSNTKAERFQQRLRHRGFSDDSIAFIRCPVGRLDVPGKRPMEVAVSMCAELLALAAAPSTDRQTRRGVSWPEVRELLQNQEPPEQAQHPE